jgi:transcriptional regulator with XRE-family HTH domain
VGHSSRKRPNGWSSAASIRCVLVRTGVGCTRPFEPDRLRRQKPFDLSRATPQTRAGPEFLNSLTDERKYAGEKRVGRAPAQDVDRYVSARIRQRRIMLGLTQQQIAESIGVTYQQAHKYEKGMNRVAVGRLYSIAQALGVEVGYFFEGLQTRGGFVSPQQRMLLDLVHNYLNIRVREHQEAIVALARALADSES